MTGVRVLADVRLALPGWLEQVLQPDFELFMVKGAVTPECNPGEFPISVFK
jgi:hypothetical protein